MPDQQQIRQLLEEVLDSGRTPEEVCLEHPALLLDVRAQWERLRSVVGQIDAMFASAGAKPVTAGDPLALLRAELPSIPGFQMQMLIGHGGMGVVYKARHIKLNRSIAIKMMLNGPYAGQAERRRFLREAEAMASLRHPHIVQVHDVGESAGLPYITMEFVEGGTLAEKLGGIPQPARDAAELVATLAEAVHLAHESGIIHRDLKPANILLTSDGAPKITDFGLARSVDDGPDLTRTGARLGTPSYMAPEQALGKAGAIGPAVDIYALGAILYEMLTGRPPFRAETAAETERQVIAEEPAPPSRLNVRVPHDLETICLKCLRKAPQRRYATALALAEDLHRFLCGEPIEARPVGLPERLAKWVRRRPSLATAIAASMLLFAFLTGGELWLISEQAAIVRGAEADMTEVARFQESASWPQADAALQRALGRLGYGGPADLRRRLEQAGRDQELVKQLDEIRLNRSVLIDESIVHWSQEYEKTFREASLFKIEGDSDAAAERIRASKVGRTLVAALDDWALCCAYGSEVRRPTWLLEVTRKADPDPSGWRDRFRDPAARNQKEELSRLAESANVSETPVNLLVALGDLLQMRGGDAVPFLKRVQRQHPGDFWANNKLGSALSANDPVNAVRYYQAALAIRPETPGLYSNLAVLFYQLGRREESIYHARQADRLAPNDAKFLSNLGLFLREDGQVLEAVDQFRRAVAIQPKLAAPQGGLRLCLIQLGRLNEAAEVWRKWLQTNPATHFDWDGYIELSLFLGDPGEYSRVRRRLLDAFGAVKDPNFAERTGRACLLLPAPDEELRRAVALIDRALDHETSKQSPSYSHFLFAKGLAEYRLGRLAQSISIMEGRAGQVMGPAPRLVEAMCKHRHGRETEALKILAAAVRSYDWTASRANYRDAWIYHVLRREAEAMMLPNLRAYLAGKQEPKSNDERLAMLGVCQFEGRWSAAARLYADAFAADPKLLTEPNFVNRYKAACFASLAGAAQGENSGSDSGESERAHWRKQARDWLRAELDSLAKHPGRNEPRFREYVRATLTIWADTPDLAELRDPAKLQKMSSPERSECERLWRDVNAMLNRDHESKLGRSGK